MSLYRPRGRMCPRRYPRADGGIAPRYVLLSKSSQRKRNRLAILTKPTNVTADRNANAQNRKSFIAAQKVHRTGLAAASSTWGCGSGRTIPCDGPVCPSSERSATGVFWKNGREGRGGEEMKVGALSNLGAARKQCLPFVREGKESQARANERYQVYDDRKSADFEPVSNCCWCLLWWKGKNRRSSVYGVCLLLLLCGVIAEWSLRSFEATICASRNPEGPCRCYCGRMSRKGTVESSGTGFTTQKGSSQTGVHSHSRTRKLCAKGATFWNVLRNER